MVSIIIVNYKVEKELVACVSSIFKSKPKVEFEIIIVDNDKESKLKAVLKEKFPQVKYVKSPRNVGFGAGNNLGSKLAKGDYFFFLNPDTTLTKNSIDILYNFVRNNPKAGMAAPLLFDISGNAYSPQGSNAFNLINAIATFSFINKVIPNNSVSNKFFHRSWNKKDVEEFDVVPGTAFMISKNVFKKVGAFDENLFLYFEEYDLAKRIKALRYKNYIVPKAKVMHIWQASTRKKDNIEEIFSKSRYYFFKKNYGKYFALIIQVVSNFGKYGLGLILVLGLSSFLNLFRIKELMTFIGDQGWFYLSARDMLLSGQIPLVGIASSHPWLHQGPFWTYILAILFRLFNFNPLAPAYFTASIGVITVFLMYKIGSIMFSRKVGLIASFFYATSPLIIYSNRMPYHTSLIPLFTLLFTYSAYRWIKGNIYFFPFALFFLTILYNFEIETVLLWFVMAILLFFGIWKKKEWVRKIANIKVAILSLLSLFIPMIPMLLYDRTHGFPQTVKFGIWIGYHIARFFGFPSIHGDQQFPSPAPFIPFTLIQIQQLVFLPNVFLALVLLLGGFLVITYLIYIQFTKKKNNIAYNIVYLIMMISVIGYVGTGTASAAYFPLFFPFVIFMLALSFNHLLSKRQTSKLALITILLVGFLNSFFLLKQNYLTGKGYGSTFSGKVSIAKTIIQKAHGKKYNIVGKGPGSQFASYTMGYEYLTWWLGNGPSQRTQKLRFIIGENREGIKLEQIL